MHKYSFAQRLGVAKLNDDRGAFGCLLTTTVATKVPAELRTINDATRVSSSSQPPTLPT